MLARLTAASELVLAEPGAWVVSAAGFLARGGVLLFAAALLELPSPITLTLIFGMDSVTMTGEPTARFIATIAAFVVVSVVAVMAMLLVAGWSDVVSVTRAREALAVPAAGPDPAPQRRRTWAANLADVLGVSWLQSLGLLPALAALVAVAPTVRDVAVGEVLLPTSFSVPFLIRVLAGVAGPLARALVILAVVELVVTVATRRYLAAPGDRSTLRAYGQALAEVARRPGAVAGAWLVGWAALLTAAGAALWAVSLAWTEVRPVFLDISLALPPPPAGCGDAAACGVPAALAIAGLPLDAVLVGFGAAFLFALVWVAAIGLIGLASAFRSTLWTLTVGVRTAPEAGVAWRADAHA